MSRRERRNARHNAKNFTPPKKRSLSSVAVIVLAALAVIAWVAFVMARN